MRNRNLTILGAFILAAAPAAVANDIVIAGITYERSGSCETVVAPFTTPDAAITAGQYSGFVELTVSGSGESWFQALNDAFYRYTDINHVPDVPYHDPDHYQVTVSSTTLVGFPTPGYETQQAYRKIYFDVDAGIEVAPDYTPAYRPDHTYRFVVATGLVAPGNLHFGVADGNYSRNAGAYSIEVCQLVEVPPAECWLFAGRGAGKARVTVDGVQFQTQIAVVNQSWEVLQDDIPAFALPTRRVSSNGLWRIDRPMVMSVQVVMYNPEVFPLNPHQWTQRLDVYAAANEQPRVSRHGTLNGMHIDHDVFFGPDGRWYIQFPFTIDVP